MAGLSLRLRLLVGGLALAVASCSSPPTTKSEPVPTLRSALAQVRGSYEWNDDLKKYVFSEQGAIEKLVDAASDQTIRDLVNCLDDVSPSRTTLKGQPVPVGVICHQALSQIIYYEPTTTNGDLAGQWPGHLEPTATAADLAAAKSAWSDVVEKKAYKRL